MHLLGVYSSHDLQDSLGRLAKKLAAMRASGGPRRQPVSRRQRPRRPGWVLEAIVQVLADRGEPVRAKDIHSAVESEHSVGTQAWPLLVHPARLSGRRGGALARPGKDKAPNHCRRASQAPRQRPSRAVENSEPTARKRVRHELVKRLRQERSTRREERLG
jgi:hypothetical protein